MTNLLVKTASKNSKVKLSKSLFKVHLFRKNDTVSSCGRKDAAQRRHSVGNSRQAEFSHSHVFRCHLIRTCTRSRGSARISRRSQHLLLALHIPFGRWNRTGEPWEQMCSSEKNFFQKMIKPFGFHPHFDKQ